MTNNIKAAKNIVIYVLRHMAQNGDIHTASELFDVQSGDLKVLYQHITVLSNILNDAKKDIEEEINKNM